MNLSWNGFDYEGSVAVCEMLRGNKYLREVDVSHNRVNWEGAMLIAKGLKENDTLEILYVSTAAAASPVDTVARQSPTAECAHADSRECPIVLL